jgi:PKD repeat protein
MTALNYYKNIEEAYFMKHRIILRGTIFCLILTLLVPAFPVLADSPFSSPEADGDGLSNELETSGWYSLAGGPFITDPLDADSDNDGLSDGEEKLYGTDPINSEDPGIYVRYEDSFKTREYFSPENEMEEDEFGNPIRRYLPVLQGGDRYLMTEAMVVRRGTLFHVGGPSGASLSITYDHSGPTMTALTPMANTCEGGWDVTAPITVSTSPLTFATVGVYTATVTLGMWSDSMPLYVIFELPSSLSQQQIDAYIYDDDPANLRDEVSVWWRVPEWSYYYPGYSEDTPPDCGDYPGSACSLWQYHLAQGYAQAFWTEQFTQKVFVNHAIQAVHGQRVLGGSSGGAVNRINERADNEFRTIYTLTHNNWSDALHKVPYGTGWTMDGGACQDNANVLTTLLRSVGIAAKTFIVDYNKTQGHGESGQFNNPYEYDTSVMIWMNDPSNPIWRWKTARSYNGEEASDVYYPYYNGRVPHNEFSNCPYCNSTYESRGDLIVTSSENWDWQEGSDGIGMVNTVWDGQQEGVPTDEFSYPNNNWDYQWWSDSPLVILRSPYLDILNQEAWGNRSYTWAPSEWRDPIVSNPAGRGVTLTYQVPTGIPIPATPLEDWPYNPVPTACSPSSYVDNDGDPEPDCLALLGGGRERLAAIQRPTTLTGLTYVSDPNLEITPQDASLTNDFEHKGIDTDGDGDYDRVIIYALLNIRVPGDYQVQGSLYDAEGKFVAHATWTGSDSTAVLEFPISNTSSPYTLERLRLFKSDRTLLDSRYYKAYQIADLEGKVNQGGISVASLSQKDDRPPFILAVTSTLSFDFEPRDTNGNAKYDELVVNVEVVSDQSGSYRVEGLLVDQYNTPAAWAVSEPQALISGTQEMELAFDGRILYDHMTFAPVTQTFKLVNLKIFSGNLSPATLEDQVAVAITTPAYTRDQFEPPSIGIFEDDMERGSTTDNNWPVHSLWTLNTDVSNSPTHAWRTNLSGAQSGSLGTLSFSTAAYAQPALRFNTCARIPSGGNAGYLEVSNNSVDWTRAATFTNTTQPWTFHSLDLSQYGEQSSLQIRFNANSSTSVLWYVDDVYLNGWPAVTDASFTYTPTLVIAGHPATFTASYESIDISLPVTYTWNFGDGTPLVVTHDPNQAHVYATASDHTVALTVENPYDDHTVIQLIGAGEPVVGTSFTFEPAVPQVSTVIMFAASYTPITATNTTTHPIVYVWDLGDGSRITTTLPSITYSYTVGGNYPVQLTTDNDYGTANAVRTVVVKQGVSSVDFDVSSPRIEGDPVTFSASFTPDTASHPVTYTWDFGDSSLPLTTTSSVVEHIFAAFGPYTVTVTANNGYGSPASHAESVSVSGRPVASAFYTYSQFPSAAVAEETTFNATFEPVNATLPVTYTWNFGDGTITSTSEAAITHTFPLVTPGDTVTWTAWLTITNGWGTPATYSRPVVLPFDDDGDGLSNVAERDTYHTDPQNPDSDGDGRTDYQEVIGYIYDGYCPGHVDCGQTITTDPNDPDSDNDDLWDGLEFVMRTHPNDPDTDDDGLVDSFEQGEGSTDPINPDTDGDGLWDGHEVNVYLTDPLRPDTDVDGRTDYQEVIGYVYTNTITTTVYAAHPDYGRLITTTPIISDTDADGLTDGQEFLFGTHPIDTDTDEDTISDLIEVADNAGVVGTVPVDTDNDGVIDAFDDDSDDDGIPDSVEGTGDIDNDTIPNWRDSDDNYPPVARDDSGVTAEDTALPINVVADDTDLNDDPLTVVSVSTPGHGTVICGGEMVTYTPSTDFFGADAFTYTVSDGALTDTATVAITVTAVPDAPKFTSAPVEVATEDVAYTYDIVATDGDPGDIVTITATTLPGWLSFQDHGGGAATLSGTPTNDEVGEHPVELQAEDTTGRTGTQAFTITVSNVNDAPTLTSAPATTATEDTAYSYAITTEDIDLGDVLDITAPTLPTWLTLTDHGDGTATLSGVPANDDVGDHPVTLQVQDTGGLTDTQSFVVAVSNVNDAPEFTSTPVTEATEDAPYTYAIVVTDVDVGDVLTITASTLPAWLTLTDHGDGSATLSGTPTDANVGNHTVTLRARDAGGLTDIQSFIIHVSNVNDAPTFTSAPVTIAFEDVLYTYDIEAADVDAGDVLTITAPLSPTWLTFADYGNGTAALSGTPTDAELGDHSVILQVRDAAGLTDTQSFTVTVNEANYAPQFTSTPVAEAAEGVAYTYTVVATDTNPGDMLVITAPISPSWLTLTDYGNGTATLSGVPANDDVGDHPVTLQVQDAGGLTGTQSFTITVSNVNNAPCFTSTPVTVAFEDTAYTYHVMAADVDADDALTITASTLPAWLALTDHVDGAATLSGTPTNIDLGNHPVILQVRDAAGLTDTQSFTITVSEANIAPQFVSTAITTAIQDMLYTYNIVATDANVGDVLVITAPISPTWLILTDHRDGTATLSGTPMAADLGDHPVALQVRDIGGLTNTQSFTITVDTATFFVRLPLVLRNH